LSRSLSKNGVLNGQYATQPFSSVIDSELTRGFVMAAIGAACVAVGAIGIQPEAVQLIPMAYTLGQRVQFGSFESEIVRSLVLPQKDLIERAATIAGSTKEVDPLVLTVPQRPWHVSKTKVVREKTLNAARAATSSGAGERTALVQERNQGNPLTTVEMPHVEAFKMRTLYLSLREGFAYAVHFPERPKQFLSAGPTDSTKSRSFKTPSNNPKKGPKLNGPAAIVVGATLSTSRGDSRSKASKMKMGQLKETTQGDTRSELGSVEAVSVLDPEASMAPITHSATAASLDAIRLSAASASTEQEGRSLEKLNTQSLDRSKGSTVANGILLATQTKSGSASPSDSVAVVPGNSPHQLPAPYSVAAKTISSSDDSQWRQNLDEGSDGLSGTNRHACVEAFNWDIPIKDCQNEILSTKRSSSIQPWLITTRSGALPTLQRKGEWPAVLLSIQALSQIELLTGKRQVKSRGVVFGKVPPHHIVSVSGYSDPPIYLNTQNRLVSEQEASQTRYFVIFNAEKGAHRIQSTYLGTASGPGSGNQAAVSVGIPVPTGGSVFLNLAATGVTSFHGVVIDGNEGIQYGQGRANVSILGLEHDATGSTFTDIDGRFKFREVPFAFGYPLDVQVLAFESGITHRFQIDPISSEQQILPVFDANTISHWGEQLEGEPLRANTGVIFGALPGIFSKAIKEQTIHQGDKLAVVVRPMLGRGEILSETYWLSDSGEFLPGPQGKLLQPRFCSLNVDSGPQWVEIRTETGRVVWSDLVFMSPNVVFPLGPN
jgi:hypothetical protein